MWRQTWEGFVGGAIFTLFLGVSLSWVYAQSMYMICPKRDIVLFQLPTYGKRHARGDGGL